MSKIEEIFMDPIPGTRHDRLALTYCEGVHYAGFKPANLFELCYLEFAGYTKEGNKRIPSFHSCNVQFFTSRDAAITAYRARLASENPFYAGMDNTLEKILGRPIF
jgi:hypothetical protein